ncbi:MAG: hypothetical protein CM15mP83_9300 [Flavobacteriaceae bacterium]|nr:MAG: hypothetical protein CM15mP83_9300 [Flavobacteriaceae bacterium]
MGVEHWKECNAKRKKRQTTVPKEDGMTSIFKSFGMGVSTVQPEVGTCPKTSLPQPSGEPVC